MKKQQSAQQRNAHKTTGNASRQGTKVNGATEKAATFASTNEGPGAAAVEK